jgi:MFS family permease
MRVSSLTAAVSFSVFLLAPTLTLALIGLFGCGLGIACVWPIFIRAAAHTRGRSSSQNIAAVMTCAYAGFVLSPPLIGVMADAISLRYALWIVVLACLALALQASKTGRADALVTA